MRKFLEWTTVAFGEKLGVSHATVVKWEKEQTKVAPMQETYIRMCFCETLKDIELLHLFKEIKPSMLAEMQHAKHPPLSIHSKQLKEAI